MPRRFLIAAIAIIIVAGIACFLYLEQELMRPGEKPLKYVQVSGVKLSYIPQPSVSFTAKNLYNASIAALRVDLDESRYGSFIFELLPGQTQDVSFPLQNLVLASSKNYSVKLTFTMLDGKYETYIGSYTTPQYKGQAEIANVSLTLGAFLANFSIYIRNIGNVPITEAICTLDNQFQGKFGIGEFNPLWPGRTARSGWDGWSATIFNVSTTYSIIVNLTYIDGSTSTLSTTVTAINQSTIFEKIEIQSEVCTKNKDASNNYFWNVSIVLKNSGSAAATLNSVFVNEMPIILNVQNGNVSTVVINQGKAGDSLVANSTILSGQSLPVTIWIDDGYPPINPQNPLGPYTSGTTINIKFHSADGMDYTKVIELV